MLRIPILILLVGLSSLRFVATAQDDDDKPASKKTLMDDPRDQERLRREIWETVKHTPYSKALAYAQKAQQASSASAAITSTVTLPTGWNITPAGTQVSTGNLPFDAVGFNGSAIVLDTGASKGPQDFRVIDPLSAQVVRTVPIQHVFPGAAVGPSGALYISG